MLGSGSRATDRPTFAPPARPNPHDATVISSEPPFGEAAFPLGPLTTSDVGRILEGRQLGQYVLERFVGGGGMGAVFQALDTQLNRTVAVKVLMQRYGRDEEEVRRFRNEAQSAARLSHENIARVFTVDEHDGWNYIVFEFIDGEKLRDMVARRGALPVAEAIEYIIQVAEALQHASERDVVHRDIKPSNVLITPQRRAKLVDMGLARLHQVETGTTDLTDSGVTLGTFDYISPEQGRDPRNTDVRSDIYSLGCTLFFLLTGQPPFPHGTALQKLLSHTSERVPDPRLRRPDVPTDLARVLKRSLAKSPESRYQQPRHLIADLLQVAGRSGIALDATRVNLATRSTSRPHLARHMPWLASVALLAGLAAGIGGIFPSTAGPSAAIPTFHLPPSALPVAVPGEPAARKESPAPSKTEPNLSSVERGAVQPVDANQHRIVSDDPVAPPPRQLTPQRLATLADSISAAVTHVPATHPMANAWRSLPPTIPSATTTAAPGASSNPIRTIVVLDVRSPLAKAVELPGDAVAVASLGAALERLAELPMVNQIELRFSGRQKVQPFALVDRRLTLFASPGYWPILDFAELENVKDRSMRSFVELQRAGLHIQGVHLHWSVANGGYASLFSIFDNFSLELEDLWVTVRDARTDDATPATLLLVEPPVETTDAPPRETKPLDADQFTAAATTNTQNSAVQFTNCIVRGQVETMRLVEARPLKFIWTNGLLATTSPLLRLNGSTQPPRDGEKVQIDLDHVTALVDQGLVRSANSLDQRFFLPVDMNCTRSIFLDTADAALVEYSGVGVTLEQLDANLLYSGQRNFYEGVDVFSRHLMQPVESTSGSSDAAEMELDFAAWQQRWETSESRAQRNKVQWRNRPTGNRRRDRLGPADFLLSAELGNPARQAGGGLDRNDAGMRVRELPALPTMGWSGWRVW